MSSLRARISMALFAACFACIAPIMAHADVIDPGSFENWHPPPLNEADEPVSPDASEEVISEQPKEDASRGCAGNLLGFIALATGLSLLGFARREKPACEPSPMSTQTAS